MRVAVAAQDFKALLLEPGDALGRVCHYIHLNPVKRGYVDRAEHWRYSSARNYAGAEGLIEVDRWDS